LGVDGVSGSSSADASAAAWAEGTISAAESYVQEHAGETRDAPSGQNGAQDGVEGPTAAERAQNAFWANDPNRPAGDGGAPSPSSSGDGGSTTRESVQLSAEEAKALTDAGMTVTPDGNGGFYLDVNQVETVSVTQKAETPSAPIVIAPSNNGTTTTTPPEAPPATQPTETPSAQDAKPTDETAKADEAKKIRDAHPVKGLDKLDTLDPAFKAKAEKLIEKMQEKGWDMRVVWGRRTQEENDALVEKGLASKTSKHLEGKGMDLINRADPYPDDHDNQYYKDMEAVAKEVGLTWGGDFSTRWDPTHVEE
jgi:hypothetical protein